MESVMLIKSLPIYAVMLSVIMSTAAFAGRHKHETEEQKHSKVEKKLKKKGKIFYTNQEIEANYQRSLQEVEEKNRQAQANFQSWQVEQTAELERVREEQNAKLERFRSEREAQIRNFLNQ